MHVQEYVALNPGAQPEDYVNRLMVTYIDPNRGPDERRVIRNRLIELVKGDAF